MNAQRCDVLAWTEGSLSATDHPCTYGPPGTTGFVLSPHAPSSEDCRSRRSRRNEGRGPVIRKWVLASATDAGGFVTFRAGSPGQPTAR